jgi:hypothetical protein
MLLSMFLLISMLALFLISLDTYLEIIFKSEKQSFGIIYYLALLEVDFFSS